jgi:NADH-quinone oxidoreductase subunit C
MASSSPFHAAAIADLEPLAGALGSRLLATTPGPGVPVAVVAPDGVLDATRFLRDARGYQLLLSVTAVDRLPADPRFEVVYHLAALPASVLVGEAAPRPDAPARLMRLTVPVPADEPVVPSIVTVYATANWHERETYDMFGIEFAGHPDLRRILLPDTFTGHPLRKDHPLRYEEVAFTHNVAAITRSKPRAMA